MAMGRRLQMMMRVFAFMGVLAVPGLAGRSQMSTKLSGQTGGSGQHQSTNGLPAALNPDPDTQQSPFRDTARQRMNNERQRKLVSDTQRLLALANQLKTEAAVAGTESLTPEMLHQMDEIEKLARSVKDKMRS